MDNKILLLHLSDIHFNKSSGEAFDLDLDLRKALENDTINVSKNIGKNVDGILVTGDIAFSGQKEEYENASKWLNSLCGKLNCPEENVWTVPGNHDVDRSIISSSNLIQLLHNALRNKGLDDIDNEIEKCFYKDQLSANLLHSPLKNYISFNKLYEGSVNTDGALFWEYDLLFNDGSILRLRGLNSTLLSNKLDNDKENKLILGTKQIQLPMNDNGIVYLTMCHHPLDWLKDKDNVENYFDNRAMIQLFGHKHSKKISKIDNSLRIVAGATHPDRAENDWLPRYNFIAISVLKDYGKRKLIVQVYPRQWSDEHTIFVADFDNNGSDVRKYDLELPDWEMSSHNIDEINSKEKVKDIFEHSPNLDEGIDMSNSVENQYRKLVYRFYRLAYNKRYRIVLDLNLFDDEYEGLDEITLFNKILIKAKENKMLSALWEKVEEAHGNSELNENPFKKRMRRN